VCPPRWPITDEDEIRHRGAPAAGSKQRGCFVTREGRGLTRAGIATERLAVAGELFPDLLEELELIPALLGRGTG
jgi:hypothetical protein